MIKKLIPITLALAAMFCTLPMRGDSPPEYSIEIPIKGEGSYGTIRGLCDIRACYDAMSSVIYTTFLSDLGLVEMTVSNLLTGEVWSGVCDSAACTQMLQEVSGTVGYYEVVYFSETHGTYTGEFLIE